MKNTFLRPVFLTVLFLLGLAFIPQFALAAPQIFYGSASFNGKVLTASDTGVIVTAEFKGQEIASYVMGSDARLGDLYILYVPTNILESPENQSPDLPNSGDIVNFYISGVPINETNDATTPVGSVKIEAPGQVVFDISADEACEPTSDTDATCDGVDDDCDGVADDDYVPEPTSCGVGYCAAEGETACVEGQVTDTCLPGRAAVRYRRNLRRCR